MTTATDDSASTVWVVYREPYPDGSGATLILGVFTSETLAFAEAGKQAIRNSIDPSVIRIVKEELDL